MANKKQIHKIPSEEQQTGSGRGGRREGAGRKKGQRIKEDFELKKARSIRMTDEEYPQVLEYLKQLRAEKKQVKEQAKIDNSKDVSAEAESYIKTHKSQTINEIIQEQPRKKLRTLDEAYKEYQERQKKPQ